MFDDSMFESSGRLKTKKSQTLVISVIVHAAILVVMIIVPLMMVTDALPTQQLMTLLVAPPPPPPPPPPPAPVNEVRPAVVTRVIPDPGEMVAPTEIPAQIAKLDEPPPLAGFAGVPGGTGNGSGLGDVIGNMLKTQRDSNIAPPPPPPPPPPPQVKRQPIGGQVALANLIQPAAQPVYPPLARQARVSGVVILAATISKEGNVEDLRVISGHPLFVQAAIDAVRQWRYRPTLLNGEPIEVTTTITVTFTLGSQ